MMQCNYITLDNYSSFLSTSIQQCMQHCRLKVEKSLNYDVHLYSIVIEGIRYNEKYVMLGFLSSFHGIREQ